MLDERHHDPEKRPASHQRLLAERAQLRRGYRAITESSPELQVAHRTSPNGCNTIIVAGAPRLALHSSPFTKTSLSARPALVPRESVVGVVENGEEHARYGVSTRRDVATIRGPPTAWPIVPKSMAREKERPEGTTCGGTQCRAAHPTAPARGAVALVRSLDARRPRSPASLHRAPDQAAAEPRRPVSKLIWMGWMKARCTSVCTDGARHTSSALRGRRGGFPRRPSSQKVLFAIPLRRARVAVRRDELAGVVAAHLDDFRAAHRACARPARPAVAYNGSELRIPRPRGANRRRAETARHCSGSAPRAARARGG